MASLNNPTRTQGQKSNVLSNYAGILHLVDECVCILDKEWLIVDYYQPPAFELFMPLKNHFHKHILQLPLPAIMLEKIWEMLEITAQRGDAPHGNVTLTVGGNQKTYNIQVSAIITNGRPKRFSITIKDVTELTLKDKQLASIFDKYNLAAKSANFGIWEFNYLTKEFYWDEVMQHLFKCRLSTIEEFGEWLKLVDQGNVKDLVENFVEALKTGTDFHAGFSVNIENATRYFETFATFNYNAETKWSEKVTGIAMDVTPRKEAELALRRGEELYRMLADNSQDIIVFHQADGTVNYMSPSAYRVLGNTLEEAQAKGGMLFIHPDDVATVLQHNNAAFNGEKPGTPYECRIQHKNGQWIYFEITNKAVFNSEGIVTGIVSTARDISARKTAEDHYRMLADNITDIVILHGAGGHVEYLSPSATRLLGVTPGEAMEHGGLAYVHPEDVPVVLLNNKNTLHGHLNEQPYTCRLKHTNGSWIPYEMLNKAIYNTALEITAILTTGRDVSSRVAAEEHYRLLAENISDIVGLLTLDGKFEYISPSVDHLLGYSAEDIIGTSPFDIIHPDDVAPLIQSTIEKNMNGKEGYYKGYRVKHKNGGWVYFEVVSKPVYDAKGNITRILKSSRDITQRIIEEQASHKLEEQYKMLADNILDLVILLTPDFKRLYVSPSSLALTGYTPRELLDNTLADLVHPEDLPEVYARFERTLFNGEPLLVHTPRFIHKNGSIIYVESRIKAIRDKDGKLISLLATVRDITKQRDAEIARNKSEEQYRMLANNIGDFVILINPQFKRLYVSPSGTTLTGYSTQELLNSTVHHLLHPDDLPHFFDTIQKTILKGENEVLISARMCHKNGSVFYSESVVKAIRDQKGELLSMLATVRDITKQQKAENALRKSEEQYRMLADNIVDMVAMYDAAGLRIYVSPSSNHLLGYTPEEMLGHDFSDIMAPADAENIRINILQKAHKSEREKFFVSSRLRHKDGRWLYCEITVKAIRDENKNVTAFVSTTRNVNEWKKDQQALAESEERYRLLADNLSDMLILSSPDLKRLYVSPSSLQVTGYTNTELLGPLKIDLLHKDDAEAVVNTVKANIAAGINSFKCRFRGIHKNGEILYISAVFMIIRNENGQVKSILSTSRDITPETKAQLALADSEEKYRLLADNMSDLIILYAPNLTKLYISPSCKQFTGYTQEEAIKLAPGELVYVEDREMFTQKGREMFASGRDNFFIKHRGALKDGNWRYMSSYFNIIKNEAGAVKNILVTVRDVHAETVAQLALAGSEEKYRMLADNMFDMLMLLTPEFKRVYVSPSALQLTGRSPEELMQDTIPLSTVYKDDYAYVRDSIIENIKAGINTFICQYRLIHKKGRLLYVSSLATVLRDEKGNVKNIIITTRDITPEKTAQMLLANSEEKYRSLVETSENVILMMDENGKYLFANTVACQYLHKEMNELLGKTMYDFFDKASSDFYTAKVKEVLQSKQACTFEYNIKVPGATIWLRNTLHPIFDSNGNPYAVMVSMVDFTEIKNYAEKLRLQNEELKKIAYLQSHIVRAPLANIEGLLGLMDENNMNDENRALVQLLKKSALQLDGIVTDIVTKAIDVKHATQV